MRFPSIAALLFLLFSITLSAQEPPKFGAVDSHRHFVDELNKAKDVHFETILAAYDAHIANNPGDIGALVERCKFIGNSFFDEYEGYNLKYDETEACIDALYLAHPNHPRVLIYVAENRYGEARLELLESARTLIREDDAAWSPRQKGEVFKMLGAYHQEDQSKALAYYQSAQQIDADLDLSIQIAGILQEQGKTELAKKALLPYLEKDTVVWNINQKANLLLKLNEPEKALELFDWVRTKDSTYIDNAEVAKALADLGSVDAAREALVRDTLNEWDRVASKQRLFTHDLTYYNAELALQTYRNLQEEQAFDDFFGIKRFRVFLKDPFLAWTVKEALHFALLYVLIIICFIIPYFWILPIFGLGKVLHKSGIRFKRRLDFSWTIEHFWLVSAVYLLAQIATIFAYEYEQTMNYMFDLVVVYGEEVLDTEVLAGEMILFVLFMAVGTLFVLNKARLKQVFGGELGWGRIIGLAVVFVIFNRILLKIIGLFVEVEGPSFDLNFILGAEQEILAVMSQHGFLVTALMAAVIVPIYEEIIFRGVILGSVEKYIGFKAANVFQAILFALVHDDLSLFLFFFVFALIVGYYTRKSQGLLAGIVLHGLHNFTVLLGLYYLSQLHFGG
ncbi:MAG: CPBP family intramembrane metalloprotease [Flavobacteriaceae bacterium]|nr:CPBP family intramembrane metalloprotease [Flavobacteriaceae bacterium]